MANFNRGENINLLLWIKDPDDGTLYTPTGIPTVEVLDPDGEDYLAAVDMLLISVGYFGYSLSTLVTDTLGRYQVRYSVTDGTAITIHYDAFILTH